MPEIRPPIAARLSPPSLIAEVQVAGIEQGDGLKSLEIVDDQGPVAQGDQSRGAQFLQGSVHMHGGQSDSLAQIHLCDGKLAGVIVGQAHGAEAEKEFAQEVRDPLQGCPKPEADRPFPLDRREDKGFPPEGLRDARGSWRSSHRALHERTRQPSKA